jgi:hypothetical protein
MLLIVTREFMRSMAQPYNRGQVPTAELHPHSFNLATSCALCALLAQVGLSLLSEAQVNALGPSSIDVGLK